MLILSPGLTRWYRMHFLTIRVIVPVEAFWFLVFCLYHRPKTSGKLLGSLGLHHWLLSNGDDLFPRNAFGAGTDLHLSIELSPFWLSKADLVWKFFSQESWKGRTFTGGFGMAIQKSEIHTQTFEKPKPYCLDFCRLHTLDRDRLAKNDMSAFRLKTFRVAHRYTREPRLILFDRSHPHM